MSNAGFCFRPFNMPRTLPYLGAAALALGVGPAAAAEPLDIGGARQVFIDGRFLAETQNVTLEVHTPRKTGEWTIKPEHPWERGGLGPYSNALHDGQTYHMWYHAMDDVQWDQGHTNGCICYAWTRPPGRPSGSGLRAASGRLGRACTFYPRLMASTGG
jgi:hypothetical protein